MSYHLAQLNIAVMKAPLESPTMADFVANLERINALAESAPGFVWRFQTDEGDATAARPLGDDTLINLSVWQDTASLNDYVYRSAHAQILRRRQEWFQRLREAHVVLWWVAKGHRPSLDEAIARLNRLRSIGPTEQAFSFRQPYPAPGSPQPAPPLTLGDECPAA